MKITADLCVIGAAAGGLTTAVRARELGVEKVVVLEKMKRIGGSSVRPRGVFAVGSDLQASEGCSYDVDEVYKELMTILNWGADAKLVRKWITGTAENIRWLGRQGAVFNRLTRMSGEKESIRRTHHMIVDENGTICTGRKIVESLTERCRELGVDIYTSVRARHLQTGSGRVTGVLAEGPDGEIVVEAKAVVLSTGSISANKELIRSFYNGSHEYDDMLIMANFPSNTGDGLIMAEEIGGKRGLMGPLFIGTSAHYPGVGIATGKVTRRPDVIHVNTAGERYGDESLSRYNEFGWMWYQCIDHQPEKKSFILVDQNMIEHMRQDHKQMSLLDEFKPVDGKPWQDFIEESMDNEVAQGRAIKTDRLEDIAAYIGCPVETLRKTVEDYNHACELGYDGEFLKDPCCLVPFSKPPYYAYAGESSIDTFMGGLLVNNHQQVMSVADKPIPGLYAAGVMTSGWLHRTYAYAGSEMSYTVFSGRNAAEEVSGYITSLNASKA